MKASLLASLLALLTGVSSVKAQSPDTALVILHFSLSHVSDTTQPENPIKFDYDLCLGKRMSVYKRNIKPSNNALTSINTGGIVVSGNIVSGGLSNNGTSTVNLYDKVGNYYKDMQENKIVQISLAGGKIFAIEENAPSIDWSIGEETRLINGLTCQKATGRFKGRNYEAWFCSQLPYNNGPWKLGGLPGLIIEAYDTKKEVIFSLTSMDNSPNSQTTVDVPSTALKTTAKEFKQYQEALKKDNEAMAGSGSAGGVISFRGTLSGGTFVAKDGKPVKPRLFNNPIEKED